MSDRNLRVVHVIHPRTEPPTGVREGERVFKYGQATHGIIDCAVIHDPPRDYEDHDWMSACLYTRMAPGSTMYWMLRDNHDQPAHD